VREGCVCVCVCVYCTYVRMCICTFVYSDYLCLFFCNSSYFLALFLLPIHISHEKEYALPSFSRKVKVGSAVCLRKTIKCKKSNTSNISTTNKEIIIGNQGHYVKVNGEENDAVSSKKTFTFSISWDNPIIRFGEGIQKIKERGEKYGFEVPRYYSRIFGDSGVSAYLIAIYGLLYSTEWENKISVWQNSVLSQADLSLDNCFQQNEENKQSNSGKSSAKCEENNENVCENGVVHKDGNEINRQNETEINKIKDSNSSSVENGLAESQNKVRDEEEKEEEAKVSPYYRHQLFNELYFLVDGGTVWADSTYGIPNPYSNDFIKKVIGSEGNKEIQESAVNKNKQETKEKKEGENVEKEEVVSGSEGRSGWFNDTMAIMLQIPVEKFKVHDHIRLMNKHLTSKDSIDVKDNESNVNNYNNDNHENGGHNRSNDFNYDCNKNHYSRNTITSNTPILNHTITNDINSSNNHNSPINAINYSNIIDNYDKDRITQNDTKNHLVVSVENTKKSIKTNENKNNNNCNVFTKQKEHILKNKNEVIIAAMKVLHCVMQTHDENGKNSKIAGDQVGLNRLNCLIHLIVHCNLLIVIVEVIKFIILDITLSTIIVIILSWTS
jgi:hypothetical protein